MMLDTAFALGRMRTGARIGSMLWEKEGRNPDQRRVRGALGSLLEIADWKSSLDPDPAHTKETLPREFKRLFRVSRNSRAL